MRSTTWRKAVSIDCVCGTAGMAELTSIDVPGTAKATLLGEPALAGLSEGRGKAPGASSHWCGTVDDPHMASEVAGEDEGWMIQSLIENAEVDELMSASTTRKSSSGFGEHRKRKAAAGERSFRVGSRGEPKNGGGSSRKGPPMGITGQFCPT